MICTFNVKTNFPTIIDTLIKIYVLHVYIYLNSTNDFKVHQILFSHHDYT